MANALLMGEKRKSDADIENRPPNKMLRPAEFAPEVIPEPSMPPVVESTMVRAVSSTVTSSTLQTSSTSTFVAPATLAKLPSTSAGHQSPPVMSSPSTEVSPPQVQQAGVPSYSSSMGPQFPMEPSFQNYLFREQELRAAESKRASDMQNQLIKITNMVFEKFMSKE